MKHISIIFSICMYVLTANQSALGQAFTSSNLPVMLIQTQNQIIVDEPKITADMQLVYNGVGQRNFVTGPYNGYSGKIGIEMRGSTSQDLYDKKGYALELRNFVGADTSVALLGMPKESDWVLVGPYNDKTLLRDALVYHFARKIMTYAPRAQHIELVINGQYQGVYLLVEKIKRDKNRVNVEKNEATDVTGGYIIKIDKPTGANNDAWQSTYPPIGATLQSINLAYHYPEPTKITNAQKAYIQNWFRTFEGALSGPQYQDPVVGYRKYIDTKSFIDYMLISEAVRNVDAYRLSTYCYKNRDSIDTKLHMGPVWDYNISLGIGDYCDAQEIEGWAWNFNASACGTDSYLMPFWWEKLLSDHRYRTETHQRWKELRSNGAPLNTAVVHAFVDSMANVLQEAQVRNFQRWNVMGVYIWPNSFIGANFSAEIQYLKNWSASRFAWIDGELTQLSAAPEADTQADALPALFPNPTNGQFVSTIHAQAGDKVHMRIVAQDGRLLEQHTQICIIEGKQDLVWPKILEKGLHFYEIHQNEVLLTRGKIMTQ